jgi:hypothetical protein
MTILSNAANGQSHPLGITAVPKSMRCITQPLIFIWVILVTKERLILRVQETIPLPPRVLSSLFAR